MQGVIATGNSSSPDIAVVRRGLRCQFGASAQRKPADSHAINANLDLTRLVQATDNVLKSSLEPKLENVLAVDREVVTSGDPTARAQRKIFGEPVRLPQVCLFVRIAFDGGVALERGRNCGIADGESRLSGTGRVVIRKSGTERLIRVMAEGEDEALVEAVVDQICEAVKAA